MTDSPWGAIQQLYFDVAFAKQVQGDAKRTLFCHPSREAELLAAVAAQDLGDVVTVMPSALVDPEQMLIADSPALEASWNEQMQKWMHGWHR